MEPKKLNGSYRVRKRKSLLQRRKGRSQNNSDRRNYGKLARGGRISGRERNGRDSEIHDAIVECMADGKRGRLEVESVSVRGKAVVGGTREKTS